MISVEEASMYKETTNHKKDKAIPVRDRGGP
jgi:hypothetical protein